MDVMSLKFLGFFVFGSFQCIDLSFDLKNHVMVSGWRLIKRLRLIRVVLSHSFTLLKKCSALSRSWPKGGSGFQFCRLATIPSSFKYNAAAIRSASSFFVGKPSNLASTCKSENY